MSFISSVTVVILTISACGLGIMLRFSDLLEDQEWTSGSFGSLIEGNVLGKEDHVHEVEEELVFMLTFS